MLKTLGGAKHARIFITLTAVCSLVLAMLAAGTTVATATGDSNAEASTSVAAKTEPKKDDLEEGLKDEITTQHQSFAGGDITVEFKDVANDTKVNLWMFSTPTKLGTKTVEDGKVEVTVPADAARGSHTIAAYDEDGEQLGWTPLTVIEEPAASKASTNDVPPPATPQSKNTNAYIKITARTNAKPLGSASGGKIVAGGGAGSDWNTKTMTNGASYQLYHDAALTNIVSGSWSKCTIANGDGECTITVPDADKTSGNKNKVFYVKQVAAPSGTYKNEQLTLGDSSLNNPQTWNVPGATGQTQPMTPGTYYAMPPAPSNVSNFRQVSFGAVPYSINNPDLVEKCTSGIKVAMVLDLSGSISNGPDYRPDYKAAITGNGGLLDALVPSKSSISTFTFSTFSPASSGSSYSNLTAPTLVKAKGDATRTALDSAIDSRIQNAGKAYTNWDAGFQAVRQANEFSQYDFVLFITDGAPNRMVAVGGKPGSDAISANGITGSTVNTASGDISLSAIEAAIYSANSIKASGKKVVAAAVGKGVQNAEKNLRAISGTTKGKDYFQGDWDQLNDMLREQAQAATCGATVNVTKEVPNGNGWKADAGWDMTLARTGGSTFTTTPVNAKQTTPATGTVSWDLQFAQPGASTNVKVTETQKTGWKFETGTCKIGANGAEFPITSETANIPNVKAGDQVYCTFKNKEIPAAWTFEKTSNPGSGATVTPNQEIEYTVTARNTSNAAVHNVKIDDNLANVLNNASWVGITQKSQGTDSWAGNVLKWNVGTLAAGATATLKYKVKINANASGVTVKNVVTGESTTIPASPCPTDKPNCRTTEHFTPRWTLVKTSNPASGTKVVPGQKILYTLTVNNPSNAAVANVVVNDDLTNVVNNAALTGGPSFDAGLATIIGGNQLNWTIPSLAAGQTATVTYEVTVNTDAAGVTIDNSVTGGGSVPPATCATGNPCTTTHNTDPNWTLAKTSNPASGSTVAPGDEITYTVTATNGSKGTVNGIEVSDSLAAVLNNADLVDGSISASAGTTAVQNGNAIKWTIPSLASGGNATVTYKVRIKDNAYGVTVKNVVSGTGSVKPAQCTTDAPCETTHNTNPVWNMEKTSNPATGTKVVPGQVITYTVKANNPSAKAVTGVVATDDLTNVLNNATLVPNSINASAGTSADIVNNTLTWTVGSLAAKSNATLTYQVKLKDDAYGVTIGNSVTGNGDIPPTTCTTANPCTTTHPTDPTWSLAKTSTPGTGTKVAPGDEIEYTLTAKNPSKSAVTGVVINDDLSQVLNNATLQGTPVASKGYAAVVGNQLVWNNFTLDAGATETVKYTVKVNTDALGVTIGNSVSGDGSIPPTTCNAANRCVTEHPVDPTWSLAKTSNPASGTKVTPGQEITYTVTATNPSKKAIKGVVVTDNLTNVLNNAKVTTAPNASVGSANIAGNTLTWTIGDLPANSTQTVTYTVTVDEDALGVTIGNVVTGQSGQGEVPPSTCTTQQPCTTTHPTDPTWSLAKTSNPATGTKVKPGDNITYTVMANNPSKSAIANVIINDDLANVLNNATLVGTPVASVGDADLDGNTLKWTIGSFAAKSNATLTYTVKVKADAYGVSIGNVVSGNGSVPPTTCTEANKCTTEHPTDPTWSLAKTSNPATGTKVKPGDDIEYTLTATNPSKSAVTGVVINDDLSQVLNNAALQGDPVASKGLATVVGGQLVWNNLTLDAGATETVKYTVKVKEDALGVTIGNSVTGDGSVPPTTCTEANKCTTEHPTDPTWSLAKTSTPDSGDKVKPGDTITYTVKATNPSKISIKGVVVTDDLTDVLNNAKVTTDPNASVGSANIVDNTLTWTIGELAANSDATVTYTVTVDEDALGVTIKNVVTGQSGEGQVPPSTCTTQQPCSTTHDTDPAWTMSKESNPESGSAVQPGQEITYTVKAKNQSKSAINNVVINDDMSNVLNHSVLVGDPVASTGDAVREGDGIKWTIPSLEAKSEVTLTYTVKVNDNAHGVVIDNSVSGNASYNEGNLLPEKCTEEEPCTTTHNTPPVVTPTGPTSPAVTPTNTHDGGVTPTDGGNNDDQGVHPHTGAGLTLTVGLLALILIGAGLVLRYASRQRKH